MTGGQSANPGERRLTSWKEIAAFVGRDERTAKRWEESRGLPVRRVPGKGRASVFAYTDEIEAWLKGTAPAAPPAAQDIAPQTQDRHRRAQHLMPRAVAAIVALAVVIAAAVYVGVNRTPPRVAPGHVPDTVAAGFYRAGLHDWQTRTPSGLARAIVNFNAAVAHDPRYAAAYAGLADAYNLEGEFAAMPADHAYPLAARAAAQAIAIDPSLAEAHAALAFVDFYWVRDVKGADGEFRRAIALAPGNAVAHHWYATYLMTAGAYRAALSEIDKAERLDAESSAIPADKALILYYAGNRAEAVKLLTQLEDDSPGFASPHQYLAMIWFLGGEDADYLREAMLGARARRDGVEMAVAQAGARGLAQAGHAGMLRAMLDAQRRFYVQGKLAAYRVAETCAELGDVGSALQWLTTSVALHEPDEIGIRTGPAFAALRHNARFQSLERQSGWTLP
jgi:tetratricopeptide (TPR) repeat protein